MKPGLGIWESGLVEKLGRVPTTLPFPGSLGDLRRQFPVWRTALHVTLALDLAQVIGLALGWARVSTEILAHVSWGSVIETQLALAVLLSPIRFLEAVC